MKAFERRWLSTSETAELLGLSRKTIVRQLKLGLIPGCKQGGHFIVDWPSLNAQLEKESTKLVAARERAE